MGILTDPVRVMRRALKFASRDAYRQNICGVHLDGCGEVVSTDSFRLYREVAWEGPTLTLDYATAYDISKCKVKGNDKAEIAEDGDRLLVKMGDGTEIVGAAAPGKYPNYRPLLETAHKAVAYVNVKQVVPILKQHEKVKVECYKGDLVVSGALGDVEPSAYFEKACDGEDVSIAFNAKYLMEALQAVGDKAEIRIESAHKAAVVAWDGIEVIVMPVRSDTEAKPYVKEARSGMKKAPKSPEPKLEQRIESLEGERVCITGTLDGMTRSEAFTRLKLLGGIPCERFNKGVTMFVIAANAGKCKREQADKAIAKGQELKVVDGTTFLEAIRKGGHVPKVRKKVEEKLESMGMAAKVEVTESADVTAIEITPQVATDVRNVKAATSCNDAKKHPEKKQEAQAIEVSLEFMQGWCKERNLLATQKREGCCIWVEGDSKPYQEELKGLGFRFSKKRKSWYIDPKRAA